MIATFQEPIHGCLWQQHQHRIASQHSPANQMSGHLIHWGIRELLSASYRLRFNSFVCVCELACCFICNAERIVMLNILQAGPIAFLAKTICVHLIPQQRLLYGRCCVLRWILLLSPPSRKKMNEDKDERSRYFLT